ncbi:MAG: chemotaxis protein CheB, partial [Sphingomicrobium sp.]
MAKSKAPRSKRAPAPGATPVAIVGIGVCRASLGSLQQLFADLPKDLGAGYVIAVRQQDGLTVDSVIKAIAGGSKTPAKVAADGEKIEPGHIYVVGPDDLITITDGTIATRRAEQPVGQRGTVDSMLMSLAEHAQDRAVAVILSGLGSEGT